MRICMVIRAIPRHAKGGMEDHTMMLCEGLAKKGHDVNIVTTALKNNDIKHEKINGVKVHYVNTTRPGKYSGSWWSNSLEKILELNNEKKIDVIHSQSAGAFSFVKNGLNKKMGIPVVVTPHGTSFDEIRTAINTDISWNLLSTIRGVAKILYHTHFYFSTGKKMMQNSDAVIAISNEQKDILMKKYSVDEGRLFLVYTGVDTKKFMPKKTKKSIAIKKKFAPNGKLIAAVSRLVKEKGLQNSIKAMGKIVDKYSRTDARLLIIGDGPYRNELEKITKELGMEDYVSFAGFIDFNHINDYFNACDVFVNSTIRQNGYDLTIIQAMASGKPVVVSNIGSVPTAVSVDDGVLVTPGDVDDLARKINGLLDDKKRINFISKRARKKAEKYFSLNSMINNTIKLYKSLQK